MPPALVRAGRWLRWVDADGRLVDERVIDANPARAAELLAGGLDRIPTPILDFVRQRAGRTVVEVSDRPVQEWLERNGLLARVPGPDERRAMRRTGFRPEKDERALLLAVARQRLEHAMQAPEATLSALAREEERVRRVQRRETNAAENWVSEGTPILSDYARISSATRDQLDQHLRELTRALEVEARKLAPNLSSVVGPVVAAHLLSAAGGLGRLSKMDASRIQLLGARRRFGPGRSPRFGLLYRAEGMSEVPPSRWGAYARSIAGLAAIAARVDAASGRPVAAELVRRRARRIAQLQERSR